MTEQSPNLHHEAACEKTQYFTPVKLSYDGQKILTSVDNSIKIYAIPESPGEVRLINESSYKEKDNIYDYSWFTDTSKYISLVKDHPILLHSSTNHKILMKYTVLNHLYEVRSPLSISLEGNAGFYTGLGNQVKYFDFETSISASYSLSIEQLHIKPKTIVSAVGGKEDLLAIGTYSKSVYLFAKDSGKTVGMLEGHKGGIIQCEFRDQLLYVGCRKENSILAWDLRYTSYPVNTFSFYRQHETNQRILFDLNQDETELIVGNEDGSIYKYSTTNGNLLSYFMGHFDAVNSVQVFGNRLATSSGQRHIEENEDPWCSLIRVWDYQQIPDI